MKYIEKVYSTYDRGGPLRRNKAYINKKMLERKRLEKEKEKVTIFSKIKKLFK
jgi:hypothetical protein